MATIDITAGSAGGMLHLGDPCVYCEVPHDDVAPGPCTSMTSAYARRAKLLTDLAAETEAWSKRKAGFDASIAECNRIITLAGNGFDTIKIALAETVLDVGQYAKGGRDRASVVADAIKQLATGEPIRRFYGDLWHVKFATKNYDAWSGQRSDCEYGYGPRHGSICFAVGLKREVRARDPQSLTAAETEAAIYYLHNLKAIQAAKSSHPQQEMADEG